MLFLKLGFLIYFALCFLSSSSAIIAKFTELAEIPKKQFRSLSVKQVFQDNLIGSGMTKNGKPCLFSYHAYEKGKILYYKLPPNYRGDFTEFKDFSRPDEKGNFIFLTEHKAPNQQNAVLERIWRFDEGGIHLLDTITVEKQTIRPKGEEKEDKSLVRIPLIGTLAYRKNDKLYFYTTDKSKQLHMIQLLPETTIHMATQEASGKMPVFIAGTCSQGFWWIKDRSLKLREGPETGKERKALEVVAQNPLLETMWIKVSNPNQEQPNFGFIYEYDLKNNQYKKIMEDSPEGKIFFTATNGTSLFRVFSEEKINKPYLLSSLWESKVIKKLLDDRDPFFETINGYNLWIAKYPSEDMISILAKDFSRKTDLQAWIPAEGWKELRRYLNRLLSGDGVNIKTIFDAVMLNDYHLYGTMEGQKGKTHFFKIDFDNSSS